MGGAKAKKPGKTQPQNSRNEERSHDVVDNKGLILGTHDVDENKEDT
jgi:hypothetical protein